MANEKEQKMEARNEDIEMLKVLIQESFSELHELVSWLDGNNFRGHDQLQWQADTGQLRHALATESL